MHTSMEDSVAQRCSRHASRRHASSGDGRV